MAYEDWSDELQGLFDDAPGAGYFTSEQHYQAEALFDVGFTMSSAEYEALGYSADDIMAIRDEYFDVLGIDAADFDWHGWREAMGYE